MHAPDIALFDTALGSENLGDHIIMDAVIRELIQLFPQSRFSHFPTHQELAPESLKQSKKNDLGFVGGTNILRNRWYRRARKNQWRVAPQRFSSLPEVVMFGVGCNNYQQNPSAYTRKCYQRLLNHRLLHSVRDDYSLQYLKKLGIENAVNTACPTMWTLNKDLLAKLPKQKANRVVICLTDYRPDPEPDKLFIEQILQLYTRVYFWPQGPADKAYLNSIASPEQLQKISLLAPRLAAYDEVLGGGQIDFIGTRLHAGMRALQKQCRALVVGVDNRALEKQKNFNIPVLQRNNIDRLMDTVRRGFDIDIHLPDEAIATWKAQF